MLAPDVCASNSTAVPMLAIAMLGPGRVGRALLERLRSQAPAEWALEVIANSTSTRWGECPNKRWTCDPEALEGRRASDLDVLPELLCRRAAVAQVIIDATASSEVASRHAEWLSQGIHVVTANKLALAADSGAWRQLQAAQSQAKYGVSATVGAGLPVLDAVRRIALAGEPVKRIRAVLSGSLGFFCSRLNAGDLPSSSLKKAHQHGLTEPDPRTDLGGQDVARKLVILARCAGLALEESEIKVQNLVPEKLEALSLQSFNDQIETLRINR